MPVKLVIEFVNSTVGGTDISFQATPKGKTTPDEVDLANTVVAACNLLNDEKFRTHIAPFIENELLKLHQVEDGFKQKGKIL